MAPKPDDARSDADLWMIYANKIRETYFAGQDVGTHNRIYIPPLNTQAILAGDTIEQAVTNYGVARAGDSLITPDNPMMTFSGETYSQKCLRYLQSVQLGGVSDLGLEQIARDRKNAITEKQTTFNQTQNDAVAAYQSDPVRDPSQSFSDWVLDKYPAYGEAKDDLAGAVNSYDQIMTQIYGAGFKSLSKDQKTVAAACDAQVKSIYNMEVSAALIGSKDIVTGPKTYAPAYHISQGYPTAVKGWIRRAADLNPPSAGFSFSSKDASNYSWAQVGYSSTRLGASVGWAPFFRAEYTYNKEKKTEDVNVGSQSSEIKFELKALGIQSFDIYPDNSWAPQDLKKNYPHLFASASPDLWDPMFRASYVVVGYNVSIKITMDKSTYDKIKSSIQTASSHSGGASASLFGFKLNLGGNASYSEENSTDYDKVKTNDSEYSFEIPASNNTLPVLLATLGTEVAPKNS
ncbi:hypothetical protein DPSP01_012632 [Paraphaeosphaeria sporulosa]|uniref:Uncharacterized protein n=1 Tax=Paraphaeosphaeria sporulosa TaxID=1460663 RepID=A0A177CBW9_9PLEO|nr:uncharacterized protein CC84DRAFT_1207412 [Paraphaeosphaeria sporulosa]OAG04277.1 hypothetical protein CC84DRAFT_1207412 [Paraphaeosphaeria sporulosa]